MTLKTGCLGLLIGFVLLTAAAWVLDESHADFLDATMGVYADIKAMRDGCSQTLSAPDDTMWCIGPGNQNLYQFNYDTHGLEKRCDGGVDQIQWIFGKGIMVRGSGDPDSGVWWAPNGSGQCHAVRVTVQ